MAGTVNTPGQAVTVTGGVYRGRIGTVAGSQESTRIVRVLMSKRSAYDAAINGPEFAWIPVEYLEVRGKYGA